MRKTLGCLFLCISLLGCSDSNPPKDLSSSSSSNPSNSDSNTQNSNERYTEGVHYRTLATPFDSKTGGITVTEFFWYGCSHCAMFEPHIETWKKTKPTGVTLERSPAIWNNAMKLHATVFFIAQAMDNFDKVHEALFGQVMAFHGNKNLEEHKEALATLLAQHGLSKDSFFNQLESFKVKGQVSQAEKLMKQAEVNGTPMIVVNGKYAVINKAAKTPENILNVTNFLIAKEQSAQ